MQIILWILSVLFVVLEPSKWYLSWIFTITAFIGVSVVLVMGSLLRKSFSSKRQDEVIEE
jgi:threonine/homoserine/homoserine lactone efflux protein